MSETIRRIALVIAVCAVFTALSIPVAFARPAVGPREHKNVFRGTSINWSGYAAGSSLTSSQPGAVTDVVGTWQVPFVTGTISTWSSTWVGIDGYSSSTVEQIGTEQDTTKRGASYYAWYEMYPAPAVQIRNFAVNPGNIVTCEVRYADSNHYVLSILNKSTGKSFQITKTMSANRSSAEWVMEAPWSGSTLPLANFNTASFTNCKATINGVQGPISNWANDPLKMVTGGTASVDKAVPSALSSTGDAFSVTWMHK